MAGTALMFPPAVLMLSFPESLSILVRLLFICWTVIDSEGVNMWDPYTLRGQMCVCVRVYVCVCLCVRAGVIVSVCVCVYV